MVKVMIFVINHSLRKEQVWELLTTNEFMNKWLAKESTTNWKKNGKFACIIEFKTHEINGCKITEFLPSEKLIFTWKGPEEYDVTMNFPEYLTHVEIIIQDSKLTLEHKGWRSSEDWQHAKNWHEKTFWPEKIAKLSALLQDYD